MLASSQVKPECQASVSEADAITRIPLQTSAGFLIDTETSQRTGHIQRYSGLVVQQKGTVRLTCERTAETY